MKALLTSCGRPDLLDRTLGSLDFPDEQVDIIIHDDSTEETDAIACLVIADKYSPEDVLFTRGMGQHGSIEYFLKSNKGDNKYLHLEDDWEFISNPLSWSLGDWIAYSELLLADEANVIKVLAREGSPHPCIHDKRLKYQLSTHPSYGLLEPWSSPDGILWHGFSWNPGVTRADYLRQFMPFPKWEQDLAEKIYNAGYRVAELSKPVYKHIGDGRSTH